MAHNLFQPEQFFYRDPEARPWHGLGHHFDGRAATAAEIWETMRYTVETVPVHIELGDGTIVQNPDYKAVIRRPTDDDPQTRTFGIVSAKQEIIYPDQFAALWDEANGNVPSVETMGALGKGERIFITRKMPGITVGGDEVLMYMVADSPMGTGNAFKLLMTPVRVVCQNTLMAAHWAAQTTFSFRHVSGVQNAIKHSMMDLIAEAALKTETLAGAFEAMVQAKASEGLAEQLFNLTYTNPYPLPVNYGDPDAFQKAIKSYEYGDRWAEKRIAEGMRLFKGDMTGHNEATKGTVWGWWMAQTEMENYRRYQNARTRGKSVLFGDRARQMQKGFQLAMDAVSGKELPEVATVTADGGLREAFGTW